MAYCRKLNKNKNYGNCHSLNGLFVLVFTMILMFESVSSTLETDSNNTSCSNALTCTKCTIKAQCKWSLKQQKCIKKINVSNLIASTIGECPQFSVDRHYSYNNFYGFADFNYTLKVSNDSVGFKNYLRTSTIYLHTMSSSFSPTFDKEKNNFFFSIAFWEISHKVFNQPFTEFFFIKFNKVILRFDNVADHYVTFYRRNQCADHEKDKFCAICAWNYNGYFNYLKWCSKDNVCVGRKLLYLKNNAEELLKEYRILDFDDRIEEAYVTNDCPEVNVIAVNPLSGPRSGGTVVTVTVRNHMILAEDMTIQVIVAGMVCMNPRTSGPETITCTTSLWVTDNEEPPTPGSILVKYSSDKGRLTIKSSQIFQYDVHPTCGSPRPVLNANQRLRALESGDITVPVRGIRFVKPCVVSSAQLFVVLTNGTMQFASSYCDIPVNDTYMVCRSPRVDSRVWRNAYSFDEGILLDFGLNVTNFIGNQSLLVKGPPHGFHLLLDPVLVDFYIINSTGSIEFNGRYLNNLQSDVILIRLPKSSAMSCESVLDCAVVACCENVVISEQRIICKPNVTIASAATTSHNILVTIDDQLSYTVPNRFPPPDFTDWFRIIIRWSTCLLLVFAMVFYIKTENKYGLTKTVGDPLVSSTRSQTGGHYDIVLNS
ncbi:uncharacterized protein LOC113560421 [Rhopalosiphum maidis]|uniref:uncharacterized protein LOC113560421 n=1 Tax=Rhopalosiphum maidis TaxID=43146 RepID=UPI000EFE54E2|nr:uncharacterized protein LOC113560421 [Rhopalosiphum maidis]